jgi:hypothetical protein
MDFILILLKFRVLFLLAYISVIVYCSSSISLYNAFKESYFSEIAAFFYPAIFMTTLYAICMVVIQRFVSVSLYRFMYRVSFGCFPFNAILSFFLNFSAFVWLLIVSHFFLSVIAATIFLMFVLFFVVDALMIVECSLRLLKIRSFYKVWVCFHLDFLQGVIVLSQFFLCVLARNFLWNNYTPYAKKWRREFAESFIDLRQWFGVPYNLPQLQDNEYYIVNNDGKIIVATNDSNIWEDHMM